MDYQTTNNPYWQDSRIEPPVAPSHEFVCHFTGEIFETSHPFSFCPACGDAVQVLNLDERHSLYEI